MPQGQLPVGTVTFLFSDIESSTKLWEAHQDAMRGALARHDALVRHAILDAGGHIFKAMGDGFCAAFETAPAALEAVVAAQRAISQEEWPDKTPIKVRMAVHTGTVESRGGDYFGTPVNRVARLLAAGHGGQSLISQTTYGLVRDMLPRGASLRDLGAHQLKDLAREELIYQVEHPDLPSEFPALRTLSTRPNNLPEQLTNFIGREQETAAVVSLLQRNRLVTLTGSGGTGKTRLCLQAAADSLDLFPDGVWLVELALLSDPDLVPATIAGVFQIKEQVGHLIGETLVQTLKNKQLLLMLDNCEHLVGACARVADLLVRQCPHLKILATGREKLGILGEQTYRVPSLSAPNPADVQTAESLNRFESARLFADRAVLSRSDFKVTDENASALASICYHLDGIPLAIELAAARVRSLSIVEIESKLDMRFRLLTGGSRTAVPRQQTLRALVDWSYDLLNVTERAMLQRVSVFAGGWSLEEAEAICAGDPVEDWEVLDLLTSLSDKSLLMTEQRSGSTRYTILESVRQYAAEKLAESKGSGVETKRDHAEWFLLFAQVRLAKLRTPDESLAMNELKGNERNLRAAFEWSMTSDDPVLEAELALALGAMQYRLGFVQSAAHVVQAGLDVARQRLQGALLTARLLLDRAGLHCDFGEPGKCVTLVQEAMELLVGLGDERRLATAENLLGQAAMNQRRFEDATRHYEQARQLFEKVGDRIGIANSLNNLGLVERRDQSGSAEDISKRRERAAAHLDQALDLRRDIGDRRGLAETLNNLGVLAYELQEFDKAWAFYEEALHNELEIDNRHGVGVALANLGEVAGQLGRLQVGIRLLVAAENVLTELGSPLAGSVREMLEAAAPSVQMSSKDLESLRSKVRTLKVAQAYVWSLADDLSLSGAA